ncbi:hypothetical protein IEQ34_019319 [Dendrobium chrysotoxum]|uniref:Uncharacterized protein n=1 Tax=Dendrobium chrysotoxum TaxID=161865 RepID=A0AAV7G7F4_DENCH|nr:hypothetical protein IEQ34_019319 [Dendrobium chrysotoxum]
MLCSAAPAAFLSNLDIPSLSGKMASIMLSQSFTSLETSSVVKKGCFSTFSMNGSRRRAPVRLSYFFKILASPATIFFLFDEERVELVDLGVEEADELILGGVAGGRGGGDESD